MFVSKLLLFMTYKKRSVTHSHTRDMLILDAFAKLRKSKINFVISVGLSVRPSTWNNSATFGRIFFYENLYSSIYRKSLEKIQVPLQSDKNNWYFCMDTDIF